MALLRAGVVLVLLCAAVELAAGQSEYPGFTRPALSWNLEETAPPFVIGLLGVWVLEEPRFLRRWPHLVLLIATLLWLARGAWRVGRGGGPIHHVELVAAVLITVACVRLYFSWRTTEAGG